MLCPRAAAFDVQLSLTRSAAMLTGLILISGRQTLSAMRRRYGSAFARLGSSPGDADCLSPAPARPAALVPGTAIHCRIRRHAHRRRGRGLGSRTTASQVALRTAPIMARTFAAARGRCAG